MFSLDLPQVYFVNQKKLKGKLGKGKTFLLFHADLLQMTKQTWGKSMATFTLLRFHFYPFLLMKTLSIHIAPFSNRYAMKTIGVHIAPAKRCCLSPFQNKAFC